MADEYLTRKEVAARLGVSPITVYRWKRLGLFPTYRRRGTKADLFLLREVLVGLTPQKVAEAEEAKRAEK